MDFDAKETGQKKQIAGYDDRQVIMTVTLREKGKPLEESGGVVMTSDTWFGPKFPALKELIDFDMRYYKKLYGGESFGLPADQMAMVMAMYPMLKQASERLKQEGNKLDGVVARGGDNLRGGEVKGAARRAADSQPGKQWRRRSRRHAGARKLKKPEEAKRARPSYHPARVPGSGHGGGRRGRRRCRRVQREALNTVSNSKRQDFQGVRREHVKIWGLEFGVWSSEEWAVKIDATFSRHCRRPLPPGWPRR